MNGQEVSINTSGATRPDVVRVVNGHLEAIEVKCYDLSNSQNVNSLCNTLKSQVSERCTNIPQGTTQRIVLNTQGRNYSSDMLNGIKDQIRYTLNEVYPDIPIDIAA